MRTLAIRMAEVAGVRRPLSTLGTEAVAAAEYLDAPLCVWVGNDGDQIRFASSCSELFLNSNSKADHSCSLMK